MEISQDLLSLYAIGHNFETFTLDIPMDITNNYFQDQINELNLRYIWVVANICGSQPVLNLLKGIIDDNNNMQDLLIPKVLKDSQDSNGEQKFMTLFLKSGNFPKPIVPENDGIFLCIQDKMINTIGNYLSDTEMIHTLLDWITHRKINLLRFPLTFREAIVYEQMTYISDWYKDIETLSIKLDRFNAVANISQTICISVMGHKYFNGKSDPIQSHIIENPMQYYNSFIEIENYIKHTERGINLYCEKNDLSYPCVFEPTLADIASSCRLIRKITYSIYKMENRVWYQSKFFVGLSFYTCYSLDKFRTTITTEPLNNKEAWTLVDPVICNIFIVGCILVLAIS